MHGWLKCRPPGSCQAAARQLPDGRLTAASSSDNPNCSFGRLRDPRAITKLPRLCRLANARCWRRKIVNRRCCCRSRPRGTTRRPAARRRRQPVARHHHAVLPFEIASSTHHYRFPAPCGPPPVRLGWWPAPATTAARPRRPLARWWPLPGRLPPRLDTAAACAGARCPLPCPSAAARPRAASEARAAAATASSPPLI